MSEIVFNAPSSKSSLESQIDSLQTTLASLNQQVITLQEALQERDQQITELKNQLLQSMPIELSPKNIPAKLPKTDNTLTLLGLMIKLYQFAFPPGKVS